MKLAFSGMRHPFVREIELSKLFAGLRGEDLAARWAEPSCLPPPVKSARFGYSICLAAA